MKGYCGTCAFKYYLIADCNDPDFDFESEDTYSFHLCWCPVDCLRLREEIEM